MKKAKLIFDITEVKTEVTVNGFSDISEKLDVTGTDVEKALIRLIKLLKKEQYARRMKAAIDINTWQEQ